MTIAGSIVPAHRCRRVTLTSVTVDGVSQVGLVGSNGSFSISLSTTSLSVLSSPYTLDYDFEPQGFFLGANALSQLNVGPASLTITAANASKTYGQTVTLDGTEFTESGLVNGDSVTGVTLTNAGAAGTCRWRVRRMRSLPAVQWGRDWPTIRSAT